MGFPFNNWLFKAVTMKLRWSEIPNTSLFLKHSFLFVKISWMQRGFEDRKRVGFFIKHCRSKVFMKFSRLFFWTVKLNSPIKIVLPYWQVNWPNVFDRWSRKYFSFWEGGLYNSIQIHFRFFTVKSSRIISISLGMDSKVTNLLGNCLLM